MNKSFVNKFILPQLAGTVFGLSTFVSIIGPGFAASSTVITSPNGRAISNVVLYLQDASGDLIKVKIDNFSAGSQETTNYDPTSLLQNYSGYDLVAYTVKAGNNKSQMGPGEGELVLVSDVEQNTLPTGKADYTYEYTKVSSISSVPNVPEPSTPSVGSGDSTKPVSVPEPTTITALALFGVGGLFTKKS